MKQDCTKYHILNEYSINIIYTIFWEDIIIPETLFQTFS